MVDLFFSIQRHCWTGNFENCLSTVFNIQAEEAILSLWQRFPALNFIHQGHTIKCGCLTTLIGMVSPYVKAELTAAVSSLGYCDGGKYFKDQYCLGNYILTDITIWGIVTCCVCVFLCGL